MPQDEKVTLATFADDTSILVVDSSQEAATEKLQNSIHQVEQWTKDWKTKLNELKSTHITFALRKIDPQHNVYLNGIPVPRNETAKYLGMHLDTRLTWRPHIKLKAEQLRMKLRQLYWLIGRKSKMKLSIKRLIYQSIIKPIWTYRAQLWGCTKDSNRLIIQRCQNYALRMITNARWYQKNEDLHADMQIKTIEETIQELVLTHSLRLRQHVNVGAANLLNFGEDVRRLKRRKIQDMM